MNASWAGAMGLTQFMPSEYYTLAYDLDGDGRKDIWGSVGDALASAANQLQGQGLGAGAELGLRGAPAARTDLPGRGADHATPGARVDQGWRGAHARPRVPGRHPLDAPAFLLTPAGAYGPAFLALENFLVIKRYNMSDLYALFVGNLADRIAGGGDFETPWGSVRQLSAKSVEQLQERMQGARLRGGQGRRQGRHEHARPGRRLPEGQRPEGRLLADRAVLTHMRGTGPEMAASRPMAPTPTQGGAGRGRERVIVRPAGRGSLRPAVALGGRAVRRPRSRAPTPAASRRPAQAARCICGRPRMRAASRARCSIASRPTSCSTPMSSSCAASQPEHIKPPGAYISDLVTPAARRDRPQLARQAALLAAIEAAYGVDRHVLLAIWGVESAYGTRWARAASCARWPRWPSTDERRSELWRSELIAALRILQDGADGARERSSAPGPAPPGTRSSFPPPTPRTPSTSTRTAGATSGARSPTRWPRPPTICARPAGRPARRGASRSPCRPSSTYAWSAPGRPQSAVAMAGRRRAHSGSGPGNAAPRPAAAAGAARRCARPGLPGHQEFPRHPALQQRHGLRAGVGHLADRIAGGAPLAAAWPRRQASRPRRARGAAAAAGDPRARYGRLRRHHGRPDARRHPLDPAHPQTGRGRPSELPNCCSGCAPSAAP